MKNDILHGNSMLAKHMKTPWRPVVFRGNSVENSTLHFNGVSMF